MSNRNTSVLFHFSYFLNDNNQPFSVPVHLSPVVHFELNFGIRRKLLTILWKHINNLIFVVPCIMLNSEINPTRCNNCVYSSQWLYSTCFGWHIQHIQHIYSWWWVELSPETCRVKPLRRINAIVASCWIYFTTIHINNSISTQFIHKQMHIY